MVTLHKFSKLDSEFSAVNTDHLDVFRKLHRLKLPKNLGFLDSDGLLDCQVRGDTHPGLLTRNAVARANDGLRKLSIKKRHVLSQAFMDVSVE